MNFTQLFKRRHSLPFFFAALLLVTATIKWTRATGADTTAPTPENTALIFDLDGVVLKKPKIYDPVCKHKSALAKAAISPALWANIIKLLSNGAAGGQYQALFKKEHPELVTLVNEIMQSKELMPETVALIQELAAAGYSLHIASNMDASDFEFFAQKYPELFSLFKVKKLITYSTNPEEKPIKKPNHAYFSQLLKELEEQGEKKDNLIFIDDLPKNVTAAQETEKEKRAGLSAIVFQDGAQLRQELQDRKILTTQTH